MQFGRYLVVSNQELGIDRKNYENDFREYVVMDEKGEQYGWYRMIEHAINLAKGMHKSDLKQLNKEIDKLLTSK